MDINYKVATFQHHKKVALVSRLSLEKANWAGETGEMIVKHKLRQSSEKLGTLHVLQIPFLSPLNFSAVFYKSLS